MIIGSCGTELADPSSQSEVQALLDAGTAKLIEDVRVALPAGSPVTVDSPIGCGTPIRINNDRTLTIFDANVTDETVEFYDDLNNRKIAWVLLYLCDSGKVLYIDPPQGITTTADVIIPEQNNELQRVEATMSWRDKSLPTQSDAPTGIFG